VVRGIRHGDACIDASAADLTAMSTGPPMNATVRAATIRAARIAVPRCTGGRTGASFAIIRRFTGQRPPTVTARGRWFLDLHSYDFGILSARPAGQTRGK